VNQPSRSRPPQNVLLRLTSLRAFAALLVFAYHLKAIGVLNLPHLFGFSYVGVSFFFVLSGFVLTWSMPETIKPKVFLRNRFARIYPATTVVAVLLLIFPYPGLGQSVVGVVLRFLLLQAWVPIPSIAVGGNAATWSLSCEMAFYIALPFVLPVLRQMRSSGRLAIASIYFLVMSAFVAVVAVTNSGGFLQLIAYCNPMVRFGEFLLGVVVALEMKSGRYVKSPVLIGLGVFSLLFFGFNRAYPLPDAFLAPLFLAIIIWAAQRDMQRPNGLLASRPLVYAGEVSFCFYVVHQPVLHHILSRAGHGGIEVAMLSLVVSSVVAVILHHAVELPCQALIRGKASAARSVATHPEAAIEEPP